LPQNSEKKIVNARDFPALSQSDIVKCGTKKGENYWKLKENDIGNYPNSAVS